MSYEYRVARSAEWKCTRCGEYMLALWWEDDTGRFADEKEPLICPRCASVRDFFRAVAELCEVSRNTAEFMRLTAQLVQAVAD
jgi:DNA-directed RNA polymerase subunit RPC12/RpoP